MNIIDIHIHGISGYDTRTTNEQDILKIAGIQASCGVSEILPTIYADTVDVMRENMLAVKKAMDLPQSAVNSKQSAVKKYTVIRGVNLEGPFLNPQRCGALNAASFIEPTEYNLKKLIDGFEDIVKIITVAPEIAGALKLIKHITDMGIIVSMGHSDATYAEAEAGFKAGAKGITHLFNAMSGFHHREPGLAGFGLLNKEIYAEVIADPYHLHPKTLELIFRTKKPEMIILISDTIKSSGVSEKADENQRDKNVPPIPNINLDKRGFNVNLDRRGFPTPPAAFSRETGKLLGGAMTVVEASNRLIAAGYDETMVTGCITKNPEKYLNGRAY